MRKVVLLVTAVLLLAGMVVADDGVNGIFATTPNNPSEYNQPWVRVEAGNFDNPGPYVDVASIVIPAGKYLLTGYVQTFSYLGNAGIDCAFYVNHAYGSAVGGDRLNGSGDGSYQ